MDHILTVPTGPQEVNEWDNGGRLGSMSDLRTGVNDSTSLVERRGQHWEEKPNKPFMETDVQMILRAWSPTTVGGVAVKTRMIFYTQKREVHFSLGIYRGLQSTPYFLFLWWDLPNCICSLAKCRGNVGGSSCGRFLPEGAMPCQVQTYLSIERWQMFCGWGRVIIHDIIMILISFCPAL